MEMGIDIKKLTHFLQPYPLTQKHFSFFLFFMKEESGQKFWDRFPKRKTREREREREREKILVQRNFCRIFVSIFLLYFSKKWRVYIRVWGNKWRWCSGNTTIAPHLHLKFSYFVFFPIWSYFCTAVWRPFQVTILQTWYP